MTEDETKIGIAEDEAPSPMAQVRALVGEVKELADAELAHAKARIGYSGGIIRKAGLWAIVAVLLFAASIIALILGTLLVVAVILGPIVATLSVVAFFASAAILAALYARKIARKLSFGGDSDDV